MKMRAISAAMIGGLMMAAGAFAQEPVKSIKATSTSGGDYVPVVIKYRDGTVRAMSGETPSTVGNVEIRPVPEQDLEVELQKLRLDDSVEYAEPNLPVSKPKPVKAPVPVTSEPKAQGLSISGTPNDPGFMDQYTWLDPTQFYKGQHSGLKAVQNARDNYRVKIGVIDSEFRDTDELQYAGGYNFATIDGPVGPEYREEYYDPSCTTSHGTAVANIIAAPTNNARGMAGFVDADVYVARSMRCGSGFLFDTAEAIRWLAGDPTMTGVTPIGAELDIINLSLGASSDTCPAYLQDAINYAYAKGITVVVAAGNDTVDVSGVSPANCNHVITVASVDRYGKQSSFTNFGEKVDVAALGEMVLSMIRPGETAFHYGTSFSSPNVAGMAAMIKQTNPFLGPDEIESYLKASALSNTDDPGADIGAGLVQPVTAVTQAANIYDREKPSMSHVLDSAERCNAEVYKSLLPRAANVCQLYEVDASQLPSGGFRYVVFEMSDAVDLSASNGTPVKVSQEPVFLVSGLSAEGKQYGLGLCDANGNNCTADALYPVGGKDVITSHYCDLM